MIKVISRLSMCLMLLALVGCSKKNDPVKNLQWRSQCEHMILKGADGLLSHHDCFNRCASHYTSFCSARCEDALQEAKVSQEDARAECKKNMRLYMVKKCRHVCEMTTAELQAHRIQFAQNVAGGTDPDCPCKLAQKDAPANIQLLSDQSPGIIPGFSGSGMLAGAGTYGPVSNAALTPYVASGAATDLPWLSLPGAVQMGPSIPVGPWRPREPVYYGGVTPPAGYSDLPWLEQGKIAPQMQAFSSTPTDLDAVARRAETEREVALAFEKDDDWSQRGKSSFLKGFKPAGTFSISQDDLPSDSQGSLGGLTGALSQDGRQVTDIFKKDAKETLKNLSHINPADIQKALRGDTRALMDDVKGNLDAGRQAFTDDLSRLNDPSGANANGRQWRDRRQDQPYGRSQYDQDDDRYGRSGRRQDQSYGRSSYAQNNNRYGRRQDQSYGLSSYTQSQDRYGRGRSKRRSYDDDY